MGGSIDCIPIEKVLTTLSGQGKALLLYLLRLTLVCINILQMLEMLLVQQKQIEMDKR